MPALGEPGLSVLESLWDVTAAFWFDAEDDGTLDILIERSGKQDGSRFAVIRNNVFRDAFFLKALGEWSLCEKKKRTNDMLILYESWQCSMARVRGTCACPPVMD